MTFFNSLRIYLLATLFVTSNSFATSPNILFIAIDDLNDWVGYLSGHPQACTPNLDRLAEQGVHLREHTAMHQVVTPLGLLYCLVSILTLQILR